MLTKDKLLEIREHLERAQNPIFFYDNDPDGFCSFILLRRFLGRGRGVVIRSHPDIDSKYLRKISEFGSDYVFVLDRPFLGENFVKNIENLNIPLVWIDHHDVKKENHNYKNLFVYNSVDTEKDNEPVTYLCYNVSQKKEDIWIAIMGCIADHYLPDFSDDFGKKYPEFWGNMKKPFDAYYQTEIGKLARAISFGLKDSITNVVYFQKIMINCKSPADMQLELDSNSSFAINYKKIKKNYESLLNKAKKRNKGKILFFSYRGQLSISSDLSNELSYLYNKKIIIVAYIKGSISNLSLRGKGVKQILEEILPNFENATGGGHTEAVGARIKTEDLERFKDEFERKVYERYG